ncbi:uncharacterized protein BX664DRAFT_386688 [Halteromyces radiatus]|uniref:uncharacterized protein n=1 Tax=Halteromyces radiatus TaxID=101107 RepID=UPI00221EF371|nr:uncharacterized protein BX664DRAFT_386688 [Halteromyces radiatus]KAI8086253.1 hypothetical protein BX664DRAFT_386688 [Halteromyces radiatus]
MHIRFIVSFLALLSIVALYVLADQQIQNTEPNLQAEVHPLDMDPQVKNWMKDDDDDHHGHANEQPNGGNYTDCDTHNMTQPDGNQSSGNHTQGDNQHNPHHNGNQTHNEPCQQGDNNKKTTGLLPSASPSDGSSVIPSGSVPIGKPTSQPISRSNNGNETGINKPTAVYPPSASSTITITATQVITQPSSSLSPRLPSASSSLQGSSSGDAQLGPTNDATSNHSYRYMSMEKSFASLLRHSKLATYDRRLNQVYATPKHRKQRGDWGLKRNLPSVIRTPFVTIGQLDTVEHQTPWDSGYSQVAFIQRWKENFMGIATSRRTRPRYDILQQSNNNNNNNGQEYHNLASMSRQQFDHFLKHTITPETIDALQQALKTNQITRDQVYDYLNVSFRPEPFSVVGPLYSTDHSPLSDQDTIVEGRILNTEKGGYAVGISGVVAFLPKRYAIGIKKPGDRLLVRKFYVRHAYIDDQGKPQVTVSLQPRSNLLGTTSPASSSSLSSPSSSSTLSSPTSSLPSPSAMASHYNKHTKKSPSFRHWSTVTLDDLFATTPPNNMDELQLFLLDQDTTGRSKRRHMLAHHQKTATPIDPISTFLNDNNNTVSSPSSSSSSSSSTSTDQRQDNKYHHKSKEELIEDHSVLMNRIIALLKNGSSKKKT